MAAETVDPDGGAGRASRLKLLRPFVVEAVAARTGPELLASLTDLMGRDDLSARELAELAGGWKRMRSYCDAAQLTVTADLGTAMAPDADATARPGRTDPLRPAADELTPVLGVAPQAASRLVALARRCEGMPAAMDALLDGRMDLTQIKVLDQTMCDLSPGARTQLEQKAVRWAPRKTAQQLRADLAAEAQRLDPDHAATAAARGTGERDMSMRRSPLPGCGRLLLDAPWVGNTAAWLAINTAAKNAKKAGLRPDGTPEDRTVAQLRADIAQALLTGRGDPLGGHVPTPAELSRLAELQVVVAADTLTGTGEHSDLPAHIPGIGPLDAATARDLAGRTSWRRLIADPATGTLIDTDGDAVAPPEDDGIGHDGVLAVAADPRWQHLFDVPLRPSYTDDGTRYRPSERLRRFVHTRDATCLGPACHHPAATTQLDHTINHGEADENGVEGTTTAGDLGSLCDRIHNAKTHGGWLLRQVSPGEFAWTSPTGRVYLRHARPLIPGWRARPRGDRRERPPPPDT